MREIKFRAWHKDEEVMLQVGDDYGTDHPLDCCGYKKERQPVILMQYTGLKDKNGVEIYEGDLIKSSRTSLIYQVVWDDKEDARFVGSCVDQEKDFLMCAYSWPENEVIGNIYENPELKA